MRTDNIYDELAVELEEVVENREEESQPDPVLQDTPDFEIPEKFKNKELKDVVKSYVELEKSLGHKAQELGELRKLADTFLRQELESKTRKVEPPVQEVEVEFDDFVTDTKGAINKAVEPKIKGLEDRLSQYEKQLAVAEFQKKHPDFLEVGGSPEFVEWVKASPYRTRQYMAADQQMDLDAADELLNTWKERKSYLSTQAEQQKTQAKAKREDDLKKVTLESGSTGEIPKKVYRRLDLINLRMTDPDKFDSMYEEIAKAYSEGRVK